MKNHYEVIVGNIGIAYSGADFKTALKDYGEYKRQSKTSGLRASGETVTLFKNGDILYEHIGNIELQDFID